MRPSASPRAVASGRRRRSTTLATNCRCSSSITDWKIARSSGVSTRKGLPMSLCSSDLKRLGMRRGPEAEPAGRRLVADEARDVHQQALRLALAPDALVLQRPHGRREIHGEHGAAGERYERDEEHGHAEHGGKYTSAP